MWLNNKLNFYEKIAMEDTARIEIMEKCVAAKAEKSISASAFDHVT